MEVRHVCESCGELLAVHEHANYQQVKDCRGTMRPLCNECASWPGCPLVLSALTRIAHSRQSGGPLWVGSCRMNMNTFPLALSKNWRARGKIRGAEELSG
jgi:hypothetical protein